MPTPQPSLATAQQGRFERLLAALRQELPLRPQWIRAARDNSGSVLHTDPLLFDRQAADNTPLREEAPLLPMYDHGLRSEQPRRTTGSPPAGCRATVPERDHADTVPGHSAR